MKCNISNQVPGKIWQQGMVGVREWTDSPADRCHLPHVGGLVAPGSCREPADMKCNISNEVPAGVWQ
jgi:hypothetical protein